MFVAYNNTSSWILLRDKKLDYNLLVYIILCSIRKAWWGFSLGIRVPLAADSISVNRRPILASGSIFAHARWRPTHAPLQWCHRQCGHDNV